MTTRPISGTRVNLVIMELTRRTLLGRRRTVLLSLLPAVLLLLAVVRRFDATAGPAHTSGFIQDFALGTWLPLVCLLIGTGVIAPEIEDGSIVYMLAKPIRRSTTAVSKLVVAVGAATIFGVIPIALACLIAGDENGALAASFGAAAALSMLAYISLFFMLAIYSRNAVTIGLIYALLWESLLGNSVPGARSVSIHQWALAIGEKMLTWHAPEWSVSSAVGLTAGLVMLTLTIIVTVTFSIRKLSALHLRTGE